MTSIEATLRFVANGYNGEWQLKPYIPFKTIHLGSIGMDHVYKRIVS